MLLVSNNVIKVLESLLEKLWFILFLPQIIYLFYRSVALFLSALKSWGAGGAATPFTNLSLQTRKGYIKSAN